MSLDARAAASHDDAKASGRSPSDGQALLGVRVGAKKMQRHIRLVADHPTVVRILRYVEQLAGTQLEHPAIVERGRGNAGENEPDVLHGTACFPQPGTYMLAPAPPRFIGCAANGHPADMHELELAFGQNASLVGRIETLQNDVELS